MMFQRLLVPLDGSVRAERAIPVAARLARASGGEIIFVRVVLPPYNTRVYGGEPVLVGDPTFLAKETSEATRYLSTLKKTHIDELVGIHMEFEVATGPLLSSLLSTAHVEKADLIVMCSHGDTGMKRWLFKSLAQQTIRKTSIPVLVLGEHGIEHPLQENGHPLRVLVPLDGSNLAESALVPALQLLAAYKPSESQIPVSLHLLSVIDTPPAYGSTRTPTVIDTEIQNRLRREAESYLKTVMERLLEHPQVSYPVRITATTTVNTNIARAIIEQAEQFSESGNNYDLIAMATHGRGGVKRLFMGSATEGVLGHTKLPLLVVRPHEGSNEQVASGDVPWAVTY